jgi:hypothetical protein
MKRNRYNLLPYFIDDERSLAKRQAYVASCERFFKSFKVHGPGTSGKLQASSDKLQAASLNSNTIK